MKPCAKHLRAIGLAALQPFAEAMNWNFAVISTDVRGTSPMVRLYGPEGSMGRVSDAVWGLARNWRTGCKQTSSTCRQKQVMSCLAMVLARGTENSVGQVPRKSNCLRKVLHVVLRG